MKRIYTRSGDHGTTGIHGGSRVEKDDIRIEANGTIDELNALLGIARSLLAPEHPFDPTLRTIQMELMVVMSRVATPCELRHQNPNALMPEAAAWCERQMDALTAELSDNGYFILPGGTPVSAQLQFARTVARRAERRLWTLHRQDAVEEAVLGFVNRLSDLLFVMARWEMQQHARSEERWQAFAYKRKR